MKQTTEENKSQEPRITKMDDIIEMILEDHKPLKKLIKIMKDSDREISERAEAFAEFAPLLISHAKPEEDSLYAFMKKDEDLREEGLEGDVEHQLADQLCEEIKRTTDPEEMGARIKVLAELVEHHIEEEEEDLLPDFKDNSEIEERVALGKQFIELKTAMLVKGGEDSPKENSLH
ncbi:immunity 49 family protein [Bdellovibrio sp. SKB1291214]|uniref:hemerythrin domain-containing protein n=1 Tax=Bdellovibrio sp. SKB1291214 TaxID=1732569 RepID=UPI000B51B5BC|nr:hemerythrin domain-containing protein [Bdellovibrio sp. SKB1291214]UYL10261.1 immunity 49 family protein [Bdellovibrio sp. SKB1291214]